MSVNRFFDNPFDFLRRFGRNKVQIFIYLHIQAMKMRVILRPILIPLIAATQALYDSMFAKTTDKSFKTGQRIAETKEVKSAINNFKKAMRKLQARAFDKLGVNSPIYIQLFNNGQYDYNHIKMENAYLIITTVQTIVTTNVTELGVDMKTLIDGCYTDFNAARLLQTGLASNVKGNKPVYDVVLDQMIDQLDINRHTICLDDNTNPEENYVYFEDSVLFTPSTHKTTDKSDKLIVSVDPSSQVDSGASFGPGQTVTLENPSEDDAYYFPAQTPDEVMPLSCLFVPKNGGKVVLTSEEMGSPLNKYLIIGNRNGTKLLVVKIMVK